jgi:uncharacterized LabA/DUF88 family protein
MPPPVTPVFAVVDSQNLYHTCRSAFGPEAKVDYKLLKEAVISNIAPSSSRLLVEMIAYTVATPRRRGNDTFLSMLKSLGYLTKTQFVEYAPNSTKNLIRTEWTVGITIDTMKRVLAEEPPHRFVLVSGSGVFEPLVRELAVMGIPTDVFAFRGGLSRDLSECAVRVFPLDKKILFSV